MGTPGLGPLSGGPCGGEDLKWGNRAKSTRPKKKKKSHVVTRRPWGWKKERQHGAGQEKGEGTVLEGRQMEGVDG